MSEYKKTALVHGMGCQGQSAECPQFPDTRGNPCYANGRNQKGFE